ncbi:hypothetical protein ACFQO4_20785 [Saliphagus sp. GCM10025334]
MPSNETTDTDRCKSCKEPIEGQGVLLHGRFPMHTDCYLEVIQ